MTSILVVDDCSVDRRLIRGLLCCCGDWDIQLAANGREALEYIAESPPDLVVTDLQMPEVNGLELVKRLKQSHPDLPVLLITGDGSEDCAMEALRAGAVYYSHKAALGRDLAPTVKQVLGVYDHVHSVSPNKPNPAECCVAFELENDDGLIGGLIEHLQIHLPSWASKDRMQIAMALHEAITNAMHHGNLEVGSELRDRGEDEYYAKIRARRSEPPYCHRRVRIEATYDDDQVSFCVRDQGPGFNPNLVADPRLPENLEKLGGRGLLLIHMFMDDVLYNESGCQITMVKRQRPDSNASC